MYNVGIIGLGQIAYDIDKNTDRKCIWSHIKGYQQFNNISISSICDVNQDKVNEIKLECNIPYGYTDYIEMLDKNHFDIVSICTPISTHCEIIKKCISAGVKAIFCEKTLSYSIDEALEVASLCKKANIPVAINHILRWDYLIDEIKNLLANNAIGRIYSISGYGATALHTSSSHIIDLLVYLSNSEPEYVLGEIQTDFMRNVHGFNDVGGIGFIKFKSGVIGFIKAESSSPFNYMFEIDIHGSNGRIHLHNNGETLDLY